MFSLDTLFIIIVSVMALSLIIAVADWIYLATLGSKVSSLEREVEKRSLEFDALKKDRPLEREHERNNVAIIESNEPLVNTPSQNQPGDETIQIVRNVRGNFEESSAYRGPSNGADEENPPITAPPDTSIGTLEYSTYTPNSHVDPPPGQQPAPPPNPPETVDLSSVADDVVATSSFNPGSPSLPPSPHPAEAPWVVPLYSDATKDADFQLLWKKINDILQQQPNALIAVDLSGIQFMYEKEMEYLEKIKYLLAGQGGSLTLINCDAELLELIHKHPQLRAQVQQKNV